jgi:hypothetical protein
MKNSESKSIINFSNNAISIVGNKNSVPIRFEGKIRYQCASSIITIPVSIIRGLNLKLGDTVIMSITKMDNNTLQAE